jgi:hypothetical protein
MISINFGGTAMGADDQAGVEPAARWNNVGTGGMSNLVDGAGNVTNAAIPAFSASGYSTADDATQSGNHKMMRSYWGTLSGTMSVQVQNLPAGFAEDGYDVIVYFGARDTNTYTPKYSIGEQSFVLKDNTATWSGTHSRSTATNTAEAGFGHCYVRFENLSDNGFTLLIERNNGAQRYGISGMQIVRQSPPEPTPYGYNAWLSDAGLSEQPSTEPSASYLNDGVANLLKYAMGLAPTVRVPTEYQPQLVQVDVNGALHSGLSVRLDPQAAHLTWTVMESPDLVNWEPATTEFSAPIDHPDGSRTWHIRGNRSIHQAPVFLQIVLNYTP